MKQNILRRLWSLFCAAMLLVLLYPATAHALGRLSFTITDDYGSAVSGVVLRLSVKDGAPVGQVTSDSRGVVTLENLQAGTYTLFYAGDPVNPPAPGYLPIADMADQSAAEFTVGSNFSISYDRAPWDVLKPQRAPLSKVFALFDENNVQLPQGAVFNVTGTVTENFTATAAGLALSLPAGSYTLTNVRAPAGYLIHSGSTSLTVGSDGSFKFSKNPTDLFRFKLDKFAFSFTKLDNGGQPVQGATFHLTGHGVNISATSNEAGVVSFSGLTEGKDYVLNESSAPSGYTRSTASVKVSVNAQGQATFDPNPQTAFVNARSLHTLSFLKRDDAGTPLYGAVFTLLGDAEGSAAITAKSEAGTGRVYFKDIPHGTYTLTETTPPEGYGSIAKKVIIQVTPGGAVSYSQDPGAAFVSTRNRYSFTFNAKDEDGNVISGASYALRGTARHSATSGTTGKVTFSDLLPGTYTLSQTGVPSGLTASKQTVKVTVAENGTVTFSDAVEAAIVATATRYTVSFDKLDDTGRAVEGAAFRLKGEEYEKDIKSDANGRVRFTGLLPGTFTLTELSAPTGYAKSAASVAVSVSSNGVVTYSREPAGAFVNKRSAYDLEFIALDDKEQPARGASFSLTGSNFYIESAATRTGRVRFDELPHGVYTLEQRTAPSGYTRSPAKVEVTISPEGRLSYKPIEGVEKLFLPNLDGVFISHTGPTSFRFEATDDAFVPLSGAAFLLRNTTDGQSRTATSINGTASFYGIEPGDYTLVQSAAPQGLIPDPSTYKIRLDKGGVLLVWPQDAGDADAPLYQGQLLDGENHLISTLSFQSERRRQIIPLRSLSSEGQPVAGVVMALSRDLGTEPLDILISDAGGNAASTPLLPGSYYLVPQTLPPNYELPLEGGFLKVSLPENGLDAPVALTIEPMAETVATQPSTLFEKALHFASENSMGLIAMGAAVILLVVLMSLILRP